MSTRMTSSGRQLAHRRWVRRLRRWRPWLISLAALAAVVLVGWVVLFSSLLGVDDLQVKGVTTTPADEVSRAAYVAPGTPLARVDLAALEERVEAIPTVAAATVTRSWPHTVVVSVTDRRPVAAVFRDDSWQLMDETGVIYLATRERDSALPIVELDGSPPPQTLAQVAAALSALPDDVLATTRRVRAASMDSITLLLKDGRQVVWGSAALSHQKATVLAALLDTEARMIDVSVPSHPATRS